MSIGSASELSAQLVVEFFVSDLKKSLAFYQSLWFEVERSSDTFAALRWENNYFFLDDRKGLTTPTKPVANVRIMVNNIDELWQRIQKSEFTVETPLTEQSYGLKDFTLLDPNGFGVRFAEILTKL